MMNKILMLLCVFLSVSVARNDPFTPTIVPKDSIRPYYGETSVFDSAKIEFPSTARLIKKVEVTFQNLDGSLETKGIALSGRIDWQVPLLVTQVLNKNQRYALSNIENKMPPPAPKHNMVKAIDIPLDSKKTAKNAESSTESNKKSTKKALDSAKIADSAKKMDLIKEEKILDFAKSQNLNADSANRANKSQNLAKDSAPSIKASAKASAKASTQAKNPTKPQISPKSQNLTPNPQNLAKLPPYKIDGKKIVITYGGALKRHFVMQNPYRIVMDFEINKKFYKQNRYVLNSPHFKQLKYGLHTKFLRIVLELNGSYVYDLGVLVNGVQINVK